MPKVERICPECGASNGYDRTQCSKCRAPLTRRPDNQPPPPAPLSRHGMAILAWRATKFMTRLGLALAIKGAKNGVERVRQRDAGNVKNETIDGEFSEAPAPPADVAIRELPTRDWRVWSTPPDSGTKPQEGLSWGKTQEP